MWWLIETRRGLAVLVIVFAALVGVGIWLDRDTDLDPQALLLALTAAGALIAAAFTGRQVQLSREQTESALKPHLAVEDGRAGPEGYWALVKNHGGGVAQAIEYDAYILAAELLDLEVTGDSQTVRQREDVIACKVGGTYGTLGAGMERERLLIPWDDLPSNPPDKISLVVFFRYTAATGTERSNPHSSVSQRIAESDLELTE